MVSNRLVKTEIPTKNEKGGLRTVDSTRERGAIYIYNNSCIVESDDEI